MFNKLHLVSLLACGLFVIAQVMSIRSTINHLIFPKSNYLLPLPL